MHSVTGCLRDGERERERAKERWRRERERGREGACVKADKDGKRERGGSGGEDER